MQIKLEDIRLKSQLMASIEALRWGEDHSGIVYDSDQMAWNLQFKTRSKMNPDDFKTILWEIMIQLRLLVGAKELLDGNVLDAMNDARLLTLLGDLKVDFALRPLLIVANGEDLAIRKAKGELPGYLAKLQSPNLRELKRDAVGRFVDETLKFGEALHRL